MNKSSKISAILKENQDFTLKRGEIIDKRYRIEKILGSGAMGDVYLATDLKLQRLVAFKTIKLSAISTKTNFNDVKIRFEREARTAAKMQHPNLTSIYDTGAYKDNSYLIMEYADGSTLEDILKIKKALSLEESVAILNGIFAGISEAHKNKIIHRDLKPGNIMITKDLQVKVTDFGLAKSEIETGLTNSGMFVGTVNYISPEQTSGKKLDARSDLWSIGLIFYEMLTGERLFQGKNISEIVLKVALFEPSMKNLKIPDKLIFLMPFFKKILAKKKSDRFKNIEEAKSLLNILLSNKGMDKLVDQSNLLHIKSNILPIINIGRLSLKPKIEKRIPIEISGIWAALTVILLIFIKSIVKLIKPIYKYKIILWLLVIMISVTMIYFLFLKNGTPNPIQVSTNKIKEFKRIAVLSFENKSNDAESDWLSAAIQDQIMYLLSIYLFDLEVMDRFKLPIDTPDNIYKFINQNNLDFLITGNYRKKASIIMIETRIYKSGQKEPFIHSENRREQDTPISLKNIFTQLINIISPEDQIPIDSIKLETENYYAFEAFHKGIIKINQRIFDEGKYFFLKSQKLDSDFYINNYYLGLVEKETGNYQYALQYFENYQKQMSINRVYNWEITLQNTYGPFSVIAQDNKINAYVVENSYLKKLTIDPLDGKIIEKISIINIPMKWKVIQLYDILGSESKNIIYSTRNRSAEKNEIICFSIDENKIVWSYKLDKGIYPTLKCYEKYSTLTFYGDNQEIRLINNENGKVIDSIFLDKDGYISYFSVNHGVTVFSNVDNTEQIIKSICFDKTINIKNISSFPDFHTISILSRWLFNPAQETYYSYLLIIANSSDKVINIYDPISAELLDNVNLSILFEGKLPAVFSIADEYYLLLIDNALYALDKVSKKILWKSTNIEWDNNTDAIVSVPNYILILANYSLFLLDKNTGQLISHYPFPYGSVDNSNYCIIKDYLMYFELNLDDTSLTFNGHRLSLYKFNEAYFGDVKVNIAECYLKLGKSENALSILKEVCSKNPSNLEGFQLLDSIYQTQNNFKERLPILKRIIDLKVARNQDYSAELNIIKAQSAIKYVFTNVSEAILTKNKFVYSKGDEIFVVDAEKGYVTNHFKGEIRSGFIDSQDTILYMQRDFIKNEHKLIYIDLTNNIKKWEKKQDSSIMIDRIFLNQNSIFISYIQDENASGKNQLRILEALSPRDGSTIWKKIQMNNSENSFYYWWVHDDIIELFDFKYFGNERKREIIDLKTGMVLFNLFEIENKFNTLFPAYAPMITIINPLKLDLSGPGRIKIIELDIARSKYVLKNNLVFNDISIFSRAGFESNDANPIISNIFSYFKYNLLGRSIIWRHFHQLNNIGVSIDPLASSNNALVYRVNNKIYSIDKNSGKLNTIISLPFKIDMIFSNSKYYVAREENKGNYYFLDFNYPLAPEEDKDYQSFQREMNTVNIKYSKACDVFMNSNYLNAYYLFQQISDRYFPKLKLNWVYMLCCSIMLDDKKKLDEIINRIGDNKYLLNSIIDIADGIASQQYDSGKKVTAHKLLAGLNMIYNKSFNNNYDLAVFYSIENDLNKSIEYLENALKCKNKCDFNDKYFILYDYDLKNLRKDARYNKLMKKYNINLD